MPFQPTGFSRLLQPLGRRTIDKAVERHKGDHGVGRGKNAWTCQRHLKALLFAQVTGLSSLREIVSGLGDRRASLYHPDLRAPCRSTLGDASALRPAAVFRDICLSLMGQVSRDLREEGDAIVRLIDSTPIQLRAPGFGWAHSAAHTTGLKLHLVYDPAAHTPVWLDITSPRVNDVTVARDLPVEPHTTSVFDKGYTDYDWWHRIGTGGAIFVTRLKRNAKLHVIAETAPSGEAILSDRRVRVGHKAPRGGRRNPLYEAELRVIEVDRPDRPPLRLVTNDHDRSALEIADLYRRRWQIELFFKWIKQNLRIKSFLGRSENAVRIQLYVAIIAFLLLRLMKQHPMIAGDPSLETASLRDLRIKLKLNPLNAFAPPKRRRPAHTINPQIEMSFAP